MTRISEVHGIPTDEYGDRGQMVNGSAAYIPYLSITQGEMRLAMAAQRAKVLSEWYGKEAPQYRQAYQMFENALHSGVHGGVNFVGALPDGLQPVAQFIKRMSRQSAPAARSGIYGRTSLIRGIGQEVIPAQKRLQECVFNAVKNGKNVAQNQAKCYRQFKIEQIFNDAIVNTGHHVLYHKINQDWAIPDRVFTKTILHLGGVQGMAVAGDLQKSLMGEWVETGIMQRNAQGAAGPIGSLKSSAWLSPDPALVEQYFKTPTDALKDKLNKMKGGAGVQGIGIVPAAAAIISAIAGAIVAAAALINALRQQQAVVAAQGFGTEAYSANQSDWGGAFSPHGNNTLLLLAGAAALWWLMDEEKS